jgi:sulfide:quinone oxidoreductase
MNYAMLFAVPPHRVPKVVVDAELTDETGWIPVDVKTFKTKYEDVYAIGDVTSIKLPNGMMLPKAGVFAHGQAEVVARNIASKIMGNGEEEWKGDGSCFIEVGFGKAAMAKGNFYTKPNPTVKIRKPMLSRIWHIYKVLFEKYWMWRWF